jgi:hypothetical protein
VLLGGAISTPALAQSPEPAGERPAPARTSSHYWRDFSLGVAASLLAHEGAHVVTAWAIGAHPSFGFDRGRPTVYSNVDWRKEPRKQFLFSSMGLNVQNLIDEAVLDVPHTRGAAFERGMLASGIGTTLFYVTIGRTAAVSDIDYMARTSSLSKSELTLIYGGVAVLHAIRVHRDEHYADFFVRPARDGGLRVGVSISPFLQ